MQRNGGNVLAVQELFDAVEQHGNRDEVARDRRHDARRALGPAVAEAHGQRQPTAAERQLAQRERGGKPIAWSFQPRGDIHEHVRQEERRGEQARREPRRIFVATPSAPAMKQAPTR